MTSILQDQVTGPLPPFEWQRVDLPAPAGWQPPVYVGKHRRPSRWHR